MTKALEMIRKLLKREAAPVLVNVICIPSSGYSAEDLAEIERQKALGWRMTF